MQPNLVIYKHNSEDNAFVELRYLDGALLSSGDLVKGYEYPNLQNDEIVLSRLTANGSVEVSRFMIKTDEKNIFDLKYYELNAVVKHLFTVYDDSIVID